MAQYEFEAEDGERILIERPMDRAPKLGSWVKRGGKRYRRVPSLSTQRPVIEGDHRFVCYTQRPEDVASPHRVTVGGVEFAAISSKRQIEETVARSEGRISYDKGWGQKPG